MTKEPYYTAVSARGIENWGKKLDSDTAVYGKVKVTELGSSGEIAPAGSADVVVTFRNVHNWMAQGAADPVFKAFYDALKPGGIADHRGTPGKHGSAPGSEGRQRLRPRGLHDRPREKAGFKLVGKSEMLANPKDTKDYPSGVWTLPPTLALGDQDREKYVAIGEADNFLLKFEKRKEVAANGRLATGQKRSWLGLLASQPVAEPSFRRSPP